MRPDAHNIDVRARLMILEDEGLVAEDLRDTLTRLGHEVVYVTDRGEDAVSMATALKPDLILCDIQVRGSMDGIVVARTLHEQLGIPAVFVTAYADAEILKRATEAEPYGYVVKPFNERELRASVAVALKRRAAEDRGRAMERWLATTLGSIGDAVIATDANGQISFVNSAAELLSGWSRNEAQGRNLGDVFHVLHAGNPVPVERLFNRVIRTGVVFHLTREFELVSRTGTRIPIDDSIAPIRRDDGIIEGVVVIFRDRSSMKRAEDERAAMEHRLHEAQRLESLGVLAGGIAHDFNNLLTVILGNSSLARAESAMSEASDEHLRQIESAAQRGAALCTAMLAYAGKGRHQRAPLHLNAFVQETVNLLRVSTPSHVGLVLDLNADGALVNADASQIQQVIMNLVINAVDAVGERGGTVTLRTSRAQLDRQALADAHAGTLAPGAFVLVEVQDDGPGMSPEVLAHIFDPFFTTKMFGRGLGLAAVRGIVQQHDGALSVVSAPQRGTTFRLLLRESGENRRVTPSRSSAPAWSSTGRALIVDDDDAVRVAASMILRRLGFEVEAVATAHAALDRLREAPPFQFVMTDLTMPEMTGVELVRAVRGIDENLPILVISGWSEQEVERTLELTSRTAFLGKPFTLDGVSSAVRRLLSASAEQL